MKINKFCVGDKVKINKNITLGDIEKDYFEGCQMDTMNFLKNASYSNFNIVYEVEGIISGLPIINGSTINSKVLTVVNRPILDEKEKEYLRAVIKPFRKEVVYIEKNNFSKDEEYIDIGLKSDTITLPNFRKRTMYKNMELDKKYTLKELEL